MHSVGLMRETMSTFCITNQQAVPGWRPRAKQLSRMCTEERDLPARVRRFVVFKPMTWKCCRLFISCMRAFTLSGRAPGSLLFVGSIARPRARDCATRPAACPPRACRRAGRPRSDCKRATVGPCTWRWLCRHAHAGGFLVCGRRLNVARADRARALRGTQGRPIQRAKPVFVHG